MPSLLLVLVAALVVSCAPADERALADHLAHVADAGPSACAQLDWPATRSVVASLPESDRVVTVAHDEDRAVCAFGDITPRLDAEAEEAEEEAAREADTDGPGDARPTAEGSEPPARHPAAVVIVMADPPELDANDGTTMGGREVDHGGWDPTDLGLEPDHMGVIKTWRVGDHALIATVVIRPDASAPATGELLDAVASDLGL